ncbi:unnamed protein product [Zymoseptoria tritici ST99CH_1A5]|uniref:Endo-1,3(4)-beta-glucanase 1 carbohydrate binding domain-containing protein n=1 Tax=Zymoseptoria tritici ST99CH_1A5 TaxID=1276529 RepID=A0A1Y6LXF9_ZYMTR|nr:unnamed protein product [Zymoseptoria tritici ST99CH_1A5]
MQIFNLSILLALSSTALAEYKGRCDPDYVSGASRGMCYGQEEYKGLNYPCYQSNPRSGLLCELERVCL